MRVHGGAVKRGALIVFEGLDGCGKSTQLSLAAEVLRTKGLDPVVTREPTDGPWGRKIRAMAASGEAVSPETELEWFFEDRLAFTLQLIKEIKSRKKSAIKNNLTPCFRLNLTSDLPWENLSVMLPFPFLQFYDYTKDKKRMLRYLNGELPPNYY